MRTDTAQAAPAVFAFPPLPGGRVALIVGVIHHGRTTWAANPASPQNRASAPLPGLEPCERTPGCARLAGHRGACRPADEPRRLLAPYLGRVSAR